MPPMFHSTPMLEVWMITCPGADGNRCRCLNQIPGQPRFHECLNPFFLLPCTSLHFNFSIDTSVDLICITRHAPQRRRLTRHGEEGQKQEK